MSREFLHSLPMIQRPKQKIIYESIAIASEIMEIGLETLHSVASHRLACDPEKLDFTRRERLVLISTSWQIVDQADLIRQLIHSEGDQLNVASSRSFMEAAQVANQMRRRMDHLPGSLSNYLANSSPMPPVHGALSFTVVDPAIAVAANGGPATYRVAVVMGASMHRDCQLQGVPYPYERIVAPLDHFALQAFGEVLPLSNLVKAAQQVANDLGEAAERQLREAAEGLSNTEDGSVERAMRPPDIPARTLIMTATYNEPA